MVAVGVEWSGPAADASPDQDARASADSGTGARTDQSPDRERPLVLTDRGQRVAEYLRYQSVVERTEAAPAWSEAVPELRDAWEKIKVKYGYNERFVSVAQPADGSWRGEGGRKLDAAQNTEVDRGYLRIREAGERSIIPGVQAVEAEDPARRLAGFEHRFKGISRLKEKVADLLEPPSKLTALDAMHAVSDAVRFTYTYPETGYAQGVRDDVDRLKARGFELDKLKNTWASDQYKGINAQWLDPESGVRFEVQFHTQASLEAKELSHKAYERIRSITEPTPENDREAAELEAFQSRVNARVPTPPDVSVIEDYRREKRHG
jgi:hypothetical protein